MNITLTNNTEDRQVEKALSMVGPVPEGADRYCIGFSNYGRFRQVSEGLARDQAEPIGVTRVGEYLSFVIVPALSIDVARCRAAEVMASYLED